MMMKTMATEMKLLLQAKDLRKRDINLQSSLKLKNPNLNKMLQMVKETIILPKPERENVRLTKQDFRV